MALAIACAVTAACTGSSGSPSTTTSPSATPSASVQAATTTVAPSPRSTLPVVPIAAVDRRAWRVDRDDVATTSLAPVTLIASSGTVTVAFSTREAGARTDTATSISIDGRTWREIPSPWRDDPPPADPNTSFRAPVALSFASGRFVAIGNRVEADTDRARARTIVATSTDGSTWDVRDLAAVPAGETPTLLAHHADEWLLVADIADGRRSTLYRSPDGITWRADASFAFRVTSLTSTAFGLVAAGIRSVTEQDEAAVVSIARDGRTWQESAGWKPYESSSVNGVMRTTTGLTIVATEPDYTGPLSAWQTRLVHTEDGTTWTPTPTPDCLVPYAGIGGTGSTADVMAVLTAREPLLLSVSRDRGTTWSCTTLDDPSFSPDLVESGAPTINGIADIDGTLTLFGGRAAQPGAKPNWNGAVWIVTDADSGLDHRTRAFRSILGYTITAPGRWRLVDVPDARDALAGPGPSGLFRAVVYDRPNRTSFADAADIALPTLAQAAAQLARGFTDEFGTSPELTSTTIAGRPAWRVTPSPDARTPGRVTYLVEFVGGSSRFLELTVDAAHEDLVTRTLRWNGA